MPLLNWDLCTGKAEVLSKTTQKLQNGIDKRVMPRCSLAVMYMKAIRRLVIDLSRVRFTARWKS